MTQFIQLCPWSLGSLCEPCPGPPAPTPGASLEGSVQRGAAHTEGCHAPRLPRGIFGEAECRLGAHPFARCGGGAGGGSSRTQLRPLWALGNAHRQRGCPGTPASLPASHLCLRVLNSSACFVDTWATFVQTSALLSSCLAALPCLPSSWQERPHPLRAASPCTALTLTSTG